MSMLEERIKRSAKKTPAAPVKQSTTTERPQREQPANPNATFLRKPQHEEPNKLKYVRCCSSRCWADRTCFQRLY